jgi:hypothetical protein
MAPLLALALLVASPAGDLPALVGRIVKAYGGEKALKRVRTVRQSGTLETMRGMARTVRVFVPPDRLRVEIEYPEGGGEVRVLDGARAWRNAEAVSGMPHDAMVLQAARLALPGILLRKKLIDLGAVERDGKKLRGIGVPLDGGLSLAIAVDPKSALILRSEGQLPGGVRFATVYSEFREVNGVIFAFREANYASGQHTGETRLEQVRILDAAPEGSFHP